MAPHDYCSTLTTPPSESKGALVRRMVRSRWPRIVFALVAVAFLVIALVDQWSRIGPRLHEITAATLVFGLLAVVLGLVATMVAWRSLLADLGSHVRFWYVWQIFFAGQLGKYV